ncbi:cytochrome P460 family protein [Jannaschia sp. S6380]|uniref:cytochrome P460 family protein n=1 Tax=Jannaschia sp. S6380 TaxID=2926408 RepID=UPI001FF4A741|nr:cytochrome P460 family protein [Jannaschia sp. S6380]MCK0169240.1 cytochrome P460 family protein [Jannaschia sp. S6380]
MKATILTAAAVGAALAAAGSASAQDACSIAEDRFGMDAAVVDALYDCMSDRMLEAYTAEGNEIAQAYRDWTVSATRPAVAGPHQNRFLLTFVNETGAEQYLAFEDGEFEMPVGSVLVKESIGGKDGNARVGPLFIMTKVDDAPDFDNWLYAGVQPNGKELKISQKFCHDCHGAFDHQDSMGYPVEEVRVSAE